MKQYAVILSLLFFTPSFLHAQKTASFDSPILTDSASTLFIPVFYKDEFFSSNKIAFWGQYYANIIVYNYQTDTYKRLFSKDTYIKPIVMQRYSYRPEAEKSLITRQWVFLLVKYIDANGSGRIDERDPTILFAASTDGKELRQLTDETENVVGVENFDQQGFYLIKIQRDSNNDKSFKPEDGVTYFRKLNLADLTFGKVIER